MPALRPAAWARQTLGFQPDPVQTAVLDSPATRLLLLTTRQWGKTSVAAARALWQVLAAPGSLVLVVAPTDAQARELNRKIRVLAARLGLAPRGDGSNRAVVSFANGSRVVGLPESPDHIRGFSAPDLILVDEAAFFDGDEILEALMPMLATRSDGALWLLSTAGGQSGFFYHAWQDRDGPWTRFCVTAAEIPDRISPDFLRQEERRNPEKFRREYNCEFLAEESALFDRAQLDRVFRSDVEPLAPGPYGMPPRRPNLRR